jgi:carboxyl-terminal processing protease
MDIIILITAMKKIVWMILLVGLLITGGISSKEIYRELDIFDEAFSFVRKGFVDPEKTEVKSLIYGAIRGMLSTLNDPYTRFMTPERHKEMEVEISGSFGGLGIVISIRDGKLTVISPIEDTPAYRAGIKAGDWISEIEGTSTKGITLSEAVKKLRGPKGTKVTITVVRKGEEKPLHFTIIRDIIKIKSVKYEMIDDETAYLRITSFNNNTIRELDKAIKRLLEKGPRYLILDIRNNGGGTLNAAVGVASRFLEPDALVLYTKGRKGTKEIRYRAERGTKRFDVLLAVLINEGTASGAEILAGAIKDNKKGVLIGKKTFGKASVQTVYNLSDGSAIALTTAYYYTPAGNLIHQKGIEPDIVVEPERLSREKRDQLAKLQNGTLTDEFVKEHNPYTEEDLNRFIESLKKEGIALERKYILREIDRKIRQVEGRKERLADIYCDTQLQRALELFKVSKIFQ